MSQDQLPGILARHRRSLSAYAQLTRELSEALAAPGTPAAVRHRLREAIEVLLPRLAASMADLLCVTEALQDQTVRVHRLRQQRAKAKAQTGKGGAKESATSPKEEAPQALARLLRAAEEQALELEVSSPSLPADRRAVHGRLAEVCRQLADRLRGLRD